jgi:CBS domain-containing protein
MRRIQGVTGSAADLMLRNPKTLAGDASVDEVRDQLANPKVQMVLLADGQAFRGAVTAIPDDAAPADLALTYAVNEPETLPPDASADEAFERAAASPHRRVIVLDGDDNLLGLLCLNQSRTGFCTS